VKSQTIIAVIGAYPDVGKGTFSGALAYLLKKQGLRAGIAKFDGYFNIDSANINPYHARATFLYSEEECFVLKDGHVTDCDHGYYERFLDEELTAESYITNGQVLDSLLRRIKSNDFAIGEVLKYKHFRDELKRKLRKLTAKADMLVFEIGGTIGDDELVQLFKVLRELKALDEVDVKVVMMSPYFSLGSADGELSARTKVTRKGFLDLQEIGLRPDIVVMRNDRPMFKNDVHYIASDCSLPPRRIISDPQLSNTYELPAILEKQHLLESLFPNRKFKKIRSRLEDYCSALRGAKRVVKIGVLGKCGADWVNGHLSLKEALGHAGVALGRRVEILWLDDYMKDKTPLPLDEISGLVVADGTSFLDEKIELIRSCRRKNTPIVAISFGADLLLKEFCETDLRLKISLDEVEPAAPFNVAKTALFVGSHATKFAEKSWLHKALKGATPERYRHQAWPSKKLVKRVESHVHFIGWTATGEAAAFEISETCFGVKFAPHYKSRPGKPHPVFVHFMERCTKRA